MRAGNAARMLLKNTKTMAMKLNQNAITFYNIFGLTRERAEHLVEVITNVCGNAFLAFPQQYAIHRDDGTFVLSVGQLLTEMLAHAKDQQEEAFILFTAHTGVESLLNHFDKVFVREVEQ